MNESELRLMTVEAAKPLAWELNGDVDCVDPDDLERLLAEVTEANWAEKAQELAELAYWVN
jgi:hypothetical protein